MRAVARARVAVWLTVMIVGLSAGAMAEDEQEKKTGWSNSTELGLVLTEGNSSTQTLGFKNRLYRNWEKAVAKNQAPMTVLTRRVGESFVTMERPTGERHSSPVVCSR